MQHVRYTCINNCTCMQAHSCIHTHAHVQSATLSVYKQNKIQTCAQSSFYHVFEKTIFSHTSVAMCGRSMQIKNTRADRRLCLLCSLSGMKCSMRHAYMLLLQRTNGCTWAGLYRHRSVHICKYHWRCIVWIHFYYKWLENWVMIDVAMSVCLLFRLSVAAGRQVSWSGGRLSEALGCSCEQMQTPFNSPTPFAANRDSLPLGKWRWVLLMSVNPDYQAAAHQLCPFSAQNTYSVSSSNRPIHADKHMKCMNKAQRENEVVIIF